MDVFKSRFYRINVNLLTVIGQWPYQELRKQRVQQMLFHISVITVMISQGIKLLEIWGNWDIMIECITPMGVQLTACCKSINWIINRDKMTALFEAIKNDWLNLTKMEEIEILKRYAERGRRLTVFYSGFLFGSLILYLLIPLMPRILNLVMPLNDSRPHTYLYQTQYYVDPEEYFYPILVHTYMGTIITVTTVIAVDSMYATYVQHLCGTLAIVGHRMETLRKGANTDIDINLSKDDDRYYRKLKHCINQHFKAVKFAYLIESSHSTSYLFQIGICVVLLSISGVQILIKFGHYEEMIRLLQFTLAQLSHLFFNSWLGQKLIDQSESFRDSVYFSEWYFFSMRARKLLTIIMIRALIPQKITAGKLYDMSMENFGAVVQTSVSYFTVFASMR